MPATAERLRPLPISSPLDELVPTRRRSPPPFPKLPDTKTIASPPPSIASTHKPSPSAKPEKKPTLSLPPEPETKKDEPKPEPKPESKPVSKPEPKEAEPEEEGKGIVDMETLDQLLELDEDDKHEFSREMVWAFFSQAESTFQSMDLALKEKNLAELSSLGHFLKGSSAALGVQRVQASCEKIQHYGALHDPEAGVDLTSKGALELIEKTLGKAKTQYVAAEKWLKNYFKDLPSS